MTTLDCYPIDAESVSRGSALPGSVSLDTIAQRLDDHLENCAKASSDTSLALKELSAEVAQIKELPVKALRWVAGIVLTAVLTLLTQNFFLHQETAKKADVAAAQASSAASAVQKIPQQTAEAVSATLIGEHQGAH